MTHILGRYAAAVQRENGKKNEKKYSDFVYTPEEGEETPDSDWFGMPFREYKEENFGSEYYETDYWDNDDEDEEEEEEDEDNA